MAARQSKKRPISQIQPSVKASLIAQQHIYSGPLPQASELEKYGEVDPTIPARIMAMAEKEQDAQHKQKAGYLESETKFQGRGQFVALFLATLGLGVVALAIMQGAPPWVPVAGFACALGPTGVAAYIGRRRKG